MIRELEFKLLCQRHRDEIYRYARSLLANPTDAEDAAQEVLLRLWNHLPRLDPFNLRAWLLRSTRNYCLDQIRRRSHLAAPILIDDQTLEERPDELVVNPSLAADSSFRLEQARSALAKPPESLRSVFVLYEVNGCAIAKSPKPSKSPSTASIWRLTFWASTCFYCAHGTRTAH
ncbi:hypothetical protein SBV1_1300005 [Verrucomicrobia bacterium]|nr:hypothetical protein SBV1_1300005 [Verrucomicrobiota bacterium]